MRTVLKIARVVLAVIAASALAYVGYALIAGEKDVVDILSVCGLGVLCCSLGERTIEAGLKKWNIQERMKG